MRRDKGQVVRLFQYWNSKDPPGEVAEWIEGFRAGNPDFEHELFNEESAARFIRHHHGEREAAAFAAAAVPAFQADFFRLCALTTFGGTYVDADNQCRRPLRELIELAPDALVFTFCGQINNGFLLFREAEDPFIRACLTLSLDNIENRRFEDCFLAAGAGLFNAVRTIAEPGSRPTVEALFAGHWTDRGFLDLLDQAERVLSPTPELIAAYRRITQINAAQATLWIGADQPAYKQSDQHWTNWKGSSYR